MVVNLVDSVAAVTEVRMSEFLNRILHISPRSTIIGCLKFFLIFYKLLKYKTCLYFLERQKYFGYLQFFTATITVIVDLKS